MLRRILCVLSIIGCLFFSAWFLRYAFHWGHWYYMVLSLALALLWVALAFRMPKIFTSLYKDHERAVTDTDAAFDRLGQLLGLRPSWTDPEWNEDKVNNLARQHNLDADMVLYAFRALKKANDALTVIAKRIKSRRRYKHRGLLRRAKNWLASASSALDSLPRATPATE